MQGESRAAGLNRRGFLSVGLGSVMVGALGCGNGDGPQQIDKNAPVKTGGSRGRLDLIKDKGGEGAPKK